MFGTTFILGIIGPWLIAAIPMLFGVSLETYTLMNWRVHATHILFILPGFVLLYMKLRDLLPVNTTVEHFFKDEGLENGIMNFGLPTGLMLFMPFGAYYMDPHTPNLPFAMYIYADIFSCLWFAIFCRLAWLNDKRVKGLSPQPQAIKRDY